MRVLIADDDPVSRRLLEVFLTRLGYEVLAVEEGNSAWETLQMPDAPKLAILDWMMPGLEGVEVCERLRQQTAPDTVYTYVILLTAKDTKDNIIKGMDAGADDYIVKPYDQNELNVRLRAGQRIVELQMELLDAKRKLQHQSNTDYLTGALNRRALFYLIEKENSRSMRSKVPFSLSMLDIDHFKTVNDRYGHDAGDTVLKEIVQRIQESTRSQDSLGRYGGEEFMIFFPGADPSGVALASERIRKAICQTPILVGNLEIPVTASQGTVTWDGASTIKEMMSKADKALYCAKENGRNRIEVA